MQIPLMLKLLVGVVLVAQIAAAHAVPPSLLNQDVTQTTLSNTVCVSGYTKSVRPSTTYTNGVKRRLILEKGLDFDVEKDNYELDHVIPLALGGHPRNLNNLMLQPWVGHDGAKRKDRLEVKLQCLVCSGGVPLEVAQEAIWADWPAAYSTYGRMACQRQRGMLPSDFGDD
jgi:hypothetical protein